MGTSPGGRRDGDIVPGVLQEKVLSRKEKASLF